MTVAPRYFKSRNFLTNSESYYRLPICKIKKSELKTTPTAPKGKVKTLRKELVELKDKQELLKKINALLEKEEEVKINVCEIAFSR